MVREKLAFYQRAASMASGNQISSREESLLGTSLAEQDFQVTNLQVEQIQMHVSFSANQVSYQVNKSEK